MGKVRRVDFYPDEFLSGVDQLSPEEVGVYWLICSKIYSRGEALPDDDGEHARIFRLDPRAWRRIKGALVAKGKIRIEKGTIINERCMAELSRAGKRIEDARAAGQEGGRPRAVSNAASTASSADGSPTVGSNVGEPLPQLLPNRLPIVGDKSPHELSENNGIGKAAGSSDEKLTTNHQPSTICQRAREARLRLPEGSAQTGILRKIAARDCQKTGNRSPPTSNLRGPSASTFKRPSRNFGTTGSRSQGSEVPSSTGTLLFGTELGSSAKLTDR